VGYQPLRAATAVKVAAWLRRYAAHPDPATAAANLVALVVASNGPFYPLYVLALIGWDRSGAWLTMLASPLFFAVPALSRGSARAGRVALPLIGIANTVWCAALFGPASGIALFLLPCIVLAIMVPHADERRIALSLAGLAIACMISLTEISFSSLMVVSPSAAVSLARLNLLSVTTLTAFVALSLANVQVLPERTGGKPRPPTSGHNAAQSNE
jgi:hypothetical protein